MLIFAKKHHTGYLTKILNFISRSIVNLDMNDKVAELPDKVLIRRVKNDGDNDSFIELCNRYENAFFKICHKFAPALVKAGVSPQDIFNEKNIIIFNCIKTYDPKKGSKLCTWICNYARYLCLNSINSRKFLIAVDSEDLRKLIDESGSAGDFRKIEQKKEDHDFLKNIISQIKDERISKIIEMRHLQVKKNEWKEIAKKMNISSQTVINLHERGIKLLRKKFLSRDFSDVI